MAAEGTGFLVPAEPGAAGAVRPGLRGERGRFRPRRGPGGAAQKPLCDRRLRPWPCSQARLVRTRRALRQPEAPLFGRKSGSPGERGRGPGCGKSSACHCGAGYGEGAAALGSPRDPGWRRVGGAGNGLGRELSELGDRRGTGAWCSQLCAPRPGPAPQTKWPRRPRLTEGAVRTRDCGAERGCRGRTPCAPRAPSGGAFGGPFTNCSFTGPGAELLGEVADCLPRPAPLVSTW